MKYRLIVSNQYIYKLLYIKKIIFFNENENFYIKWYTKFKKILNVCEYILCDFNYDFRYFR